MAKVQEEQLQAVEAAIAQTEAEKQARKDERAERKFRREQAKKRAFREKWIAPFLLVLTLVISYLVVVLTR